MTMPRIADEIRKAAHAAAIERWNTGSADTTQMLMSVDAALQAALPTREQIEQRAVYDNGVMWIAVDAVLALLNGTES